jgi:hypothetical protein
MRTEETVLNCFIFYLFLKSFHESKSHRVMVSVGDPNPDPDLVGCRPFCQIPKDG